MQANYFCRIVINLEALVPHTDVDISLLVAVQSNCLYRSGNVSMVWTLGHDTRHL